MTSEFDPSLRHALLRSEAIDSYNAAFEEHEKGTDEMRAIELASASLHLWRQVGNEQNLAIGYWLLSRIYAQFDHPQIAIKASEQSLKHLSAIDAPADWLIASIHEGWARALAAANDPRFEEAVEKAGEYIGKIADIEDRALIEGQFSSISN
jgi:hypothetical protein